MWIFSNSVWNNRIAGLSLEDQDQDLEVQRISI
jgi:hypothetical protein